MLVCSFASRSEIWRDLRHNEGQIVSALFLIGFRCFSLDLCYSYFSKDALLAELSFDTELRMLSLL